MTTPCQSPDVMGEFSCPNRAQCFEPCGELGKDGRYQRRVSPEVEAEINGLVKAFPTGEPLGRSEGWDE